MTDEIHVGWPKMKRGAQKTPRHPDTPLANTIHVVKCNKQICTLLESNDGTKVYMYIVRNRMHNSQCYIMYSVFTQYRMGVVVMQYMYLYAVADCTVKHIHVQYMNM